MVNTVKLPVERAELLMKGIHICCLFLKNISEDTIEIF